MASVAAKSAAKATHKNESKQKENVPLEFMPMENEYGIMPLRPSCACGGICPRCQSQTSVNRNSFTPNFTTIPVHTKVEVGKPDDMYEQEADRVADQVMHMPAQSLPHSIENVHLKVQRACSSCESDKEDKIDTQIQLHSVSGRKAPTENNPQTNSLDQALLTSGGSMLGSETRDFFEPRFNRDLSAVRVHTGSVAHQYCQQLDAHAFTYGNHVWLGNEVSASPSFVLAHELAHVVQQTQPNSLNKTGAGLQLSNQSVAETKVQRLPFWIPVDTTMGKLMDGSKIHKELLEAAEGQNNVTTEAPVPNAVRHDWGLGYQGYADLYRASSRVGVFFNPRQGLEVGDKGVGSNERHTDPDKPSKAGKDPKPVFKKGAIEEIAAGPKDIELGELKPASEDEVTKGAAQLKNYDEGFKDAAKLTTLWADAKGKTEKWTLNPVKRLPAKDVKIADKHAVSSSVGNDRELALVDIDEKSSKGTKSDGTKYGITERFVPKKFGKSIKGKLFMESVGSGIWMYYAQPNDFSAAVDVAKLKKDKDYMKAAQEIQTAVINRLREGPKVAPMLRNRNPMVGYRGSLTSKAPLSVARKPKVKQTKLKDDFDQKAFDAWSKKQSELGNEVRGKDKTKTNQQAFNDLNLLGWAAQAQKALSPKASKKIKDFPKADKLQEKIETGTGKEKSTKTTSLDKLYDWMERWTSARYKILGQFRLRFGGLFVSAANKFIEIKESIHQKVHDAFTKRSGEKKSDKWLVKALKAALKQVINMVVPHTMNLVFKAIENGAKKQLAKLFEDTFVEKSIHQIEAWHEEIKNYVDQVTNKITKMKEDFLKEFKWVDALLKGIGWFWTAVKAGRVLLKCRKPPILGCLALLKDAATDDELNCVLCIPWVQKQIAQQVHNVPWFANMPVELGNLILKTLHDAVPEKATILREIFNEKITNPFISIDNIETECDAKCDGFPLFKGEGGGEVSKKDAETAKEIAELHDKLSKQEIEELLKKASEKGLMDKPFDKKTAEDLLKKEPEKKPEEKKSDDKNPESTPVPGGNPQGPGGGGGACVWDSSMLMIRAYVYENGNSLGKTLYADSKNSSFVIFGTKTPSDVIDSQGCSASIAVKNDFLLAGSNYKCSRPSGFTMPTVTTEITLDGKLLFKQTDKNPKDAGNGDLILPSWGNVVNVNVDKTGELVIKMTMFDPDAGITRTVSSKVKVMVELPKTDPCACKLCVS